jgi:SAM-dependent methyltransferase
MAANWFAECKLSPPERIVEYCCGPGQMLAAARRQFPHARLAGLDGSEAMLQLAEARLGALRCEPRELWQECPRSMGRQPGALQLRLASTWLPRFSLPRGQADLLFFCFPNLIPDPAHLGEYDKHGLRNRADIAMARQLARFREMDPLDEAGPPRTEEDRFKELMNDRVVARNLRSLLRPGGLLVHLEYSNAHRGELSGLTRMRHSFMEGSLEPPVRGLQVEAFFRLLKTGYHRSRVIEDVFHQTGDPDDRTGGYNLSLLEAQ